MMKAETNSGFLTRMYRMVSFGVLIAVILIAVDVLFSLGMYDQPKAWRVLLIGAIGGLIAALMAPVWNHAERMVKANLDLPDRRGNRH